VSKTRFWLNDFCQVGFGSQKFKGQKNSKTGKNINSAGSGEKHKTRCGKKVGRGGPGIKTPEPIWREDV
jgi:hypothetical protein